jgi:hypothetical protein
MKKLVGLMCLVAALAACGKSGGGSNGGTGGVGAGTGGAAGGAGMGPALTGMCAGVDVSMGGPALHAAALTVLNGMSPCGFSSCHQPPGKAMLVLMGATDLKMTLVSKPSCEAPTVPLVDPRGGEAGLNNSWLWLKLTAMTDGTGMGVLAPNPAWGMGGNACGQMAGGQPFGQRMPWGDLDTMMLDPNKLAPIKAWICAGAPGPM